MTAPRDPDLLIRAFLSEGETDLPDRAFDAVRRDIHRTRQRVVIGPWRQPNMSNVARVAIAAAAVLAVGLAWVNFGRSTPGPGAVPTPGPSASPSASVLASPQSSAIAAPRNGPLNPGTYRIAAGVPITFVLPAGWQGVEGLAVIKHGDPPRTAFASGQVNNIYVDACTDHKLKTPPVGPTVDDLATAIATQRSISARPPTDVTVDGYSGKMVEVTVPGDLTKCSNGEFWLWGSVEGERFTKSPNEVDRIWILDVNGKRATFVTAVQPSASVAERNELQAIVDSIQIEP